MWLYFLHSTIVSIYAHLSFIVYEKKISFNRERVRVRVRAQELKQQQMFKVYNVHWKWICVCSNTRLKRVTCNALPTEPTNGFYAEQWKLWISSNGFSSFFFPSTLFVFELCLKFRNGRKCCCKWTEFQMQTLYYRHTMLDMYS